MRILYVHERLGSLGGAEANAVITAGELKGRGHTIGLLHGPSTGKGEANWNSVFEYRYPLPQGNTSLAVREAITNFEPDVVYVHKTSDLNLLQALVESELPLIRMVHDHDIYCMRSYKYGVFSRKICARAASSFCIFGCGAFISRNHNGPLPIKFNSLKDKYREIQLNQKFSKMCVVTEFMRDELLKNGFDRSKIEIHPPVPREGDKTLRSSFSDKNLIIYAGQIIRGKGVDVLLKALAKVKSNFTCVILGDGNHKSYCEKLTKKLKLGDRVVFKGFIPQEELKSYYRECSVVAISSVWPEPIATIGLEVMRYALPIVAFDAGGIKNWLTNEFNGFLVPWMDTDEYARRIDQLLGSKQLARRLGENGLEFVEQRYNFAAYIEGLEKMFASVMKPRQPAIEPLLATVA